MVVREHDGELLLVPGFRSFYLIRWVVRRHGNCTGKPACETGTRRKSARACPRRWRRQDAERHRSAYGRRAARCCPGWRRASAAGLLPGGGARAARPRGATSSPSRSSPAAACGRGGCSRRRSRFAPRSRRAPRRPRSMHLRAGARRRSASSTSTPPRSACSSPPATGRSAARRSATGLMDQLALGPSTDKYHVTGVGCASAVPLLRLAGQALRDRPGERGARDRRECVSGFMTRPRPGDERTKIVGSALFGDGCGAALLDLGDGRTAAPRDRRERGPPGARHARPGALRGERGGLVHAARPRAARDRRGRAARRSSTSSSSAGARHGARSTTGCCTRAAAGSSRARSAGLGLGRAGGRERHGARRVRQHGHGLELLRSPGGRADAPPRPDELGLLVSIGPGVTVGLMLLSW